MNISDVHLIFLSNAMVHWFQKVFYWAKDILGSIWFQKVFYWAKYILSSIQKVFQKVF